MSERSELYILFEDDVREGIRLPRLIINVQEADRRARLGEEVWRVSGLERIRYERVPAQRQSEGKEE